MVVRYYFTMVKMEKLVDEQELKRILSSYVRTSDKDRLVMLAGHFPLMYSEQEAYPDLTS